MNKCENIRIFYEFENVMMIVAFIVDSVITFLNDNIAYKII